MWEGGQAFSKQIVCDLFAHLSSIQLCPCRDVEVVNQGMEDTVRFFLQFIKQDMSYHKVRWSGQSVV